MKVKKLLSVLGLGLFAAVSVGAGVALNKGAKAEAVKADDPKTAMFSLYLNASSLESSYTTSYYRAHVWGTNIDEKLEMHPTGQDHIYTVIVSLTDAQVVSNAQFIFYQSECEFPGDKYSENLNLYSSDTGSSEISSSVNNGIAYLFTGTTDWADGHWGISSSRNLIQVPQTSYKPNISGTEVWSNFVLEPEKNRYAYYGVEIAARWTDIIGFDIPHTAFFNPYSMFNDYAKACTDEVSGADNWTYLNEPGTYDLFIENSFDGSGIISIRKREAPTNSYIYYLSNTNFGEGDTPNSIYAWGGEEQFGSWSGTKIMSVTDVQEVTNHGVLHFDGSDQYIYKIPVKIAGYPNGDTKIKFNYEGSDVGASEHTLAPHAAFGWDSYNTNDGAALDWLVEAERIRNAVPAGEFKPYSVCGISQSDATNLINAYNALLVPQQAKVRNSSALTYKPSDSSVEEQVSYALILAQLAEISGIDAAGVSRPTTINNNFEIGTDSSIATIVIISVVSISVISLAAILVVKKRKHE